MLETAAMLIFLGLGVLAGYRYGFGPWPAATAPRTLVISGLCVAWLAVRLAKDAAMASTTSQVSVVALMCWACVMCLTGLGIIGKTKGDDPPAI